MQAQDDTGMGNLMILSLWNHTEYPSDNLEVKYNKVSRPEFSRDQNDIQ